MCYTELSKPLREHENYKRSLAAPLSRIQKTVSIPGFWHSRMFSAAALIHARLSFRQILLALSYVLLESSLLASIGNTGQIQDLLARPEEDWNPHIGEETYPSMIKTGWNETSRATRRAWGEIRQYMVQQNFVNSTISDSDLREMLGQLLLEIERISAQGFNAAWNRRTDLDMPDMPFSERGILALICMSVSVITTPGGSVSLGALLADPDQSVIQEMCFNLPGSPLFHNGISPGTLRDAFSSLDELFLSLYGLSQIANLEGPVRSRTPPTTTYRCETWIYRTEVSDTPGMISPSSQRSGPRPTHNTRIRSARRAAKLHRRRNCTSTRAAQDDVPKAQPEIQHYASD